MPAQFRSLVTWVDNSIKSAQMVTIADGSASSYNLRYGEGVTRSSPSGLTVTDAASYVEVNTGVITFRINKTAGYLFAQVLNGTTQLITNSDIVMNNYVDGQDYKSSLDTSHTITIEEQPSTGYPIRAVILHTGSLRNAAGTPLCKYRARYYAYRGLDHIGLDLTVVEDLASDNRSVEPNYVAGGDPAGMAFKANSYYITMPYFLSGTKTYHFGGNGGTIPTGTVSGEHYLHQFGNTNFIAGTFSPENFYIEGVQSNSSSLAAPTAGKMEGWLNVYNGTHSIYAGIREAWQLYPKELQVNNATNSMRVSLHPLRASQKPAIADPSNNRLDFPRVFYFPRHGGACTNQVLFQFRAGAQQGSNLMAAFNAKPRMLRPASEMCASKVFGDMLEAGTNSAGFDDWMLQAQQRCWIDGYDTPGSRQVEYLAGALARVYGWRNHGCAYYGFASPSPNKTSIYGGTRYWPVNYNDTHISTGMHFLKEYVRTRNENLWWKAGERRARHWMDFDVSHCNRTGGPDYVPSNIGAGEIHSNAHSDVQFDHMASNSLWNHFTSGGLGEYYLLTGDYRAKEVIDLVGTWLVSAFNSRYPVPFPYTSVSGSEETRNWHFAYQILLQLFKATGNTTFLNKIANQGGKYFMQWFRQTSYGHVQNGSVVHANSYTTGRAAWYLPANSGNASNGVWNGGSSWMIAPLLCTLIDYFEVDKDYNTIATQGGYSRADFQDMILQNVENLVRHHYRKTSAAASTATWLYDEASSTQVNEYGKTGGESRGAPTTFGGSSNVCGGIPVGIPYVLAYGYKLLTTGDGFGTPTHPNPAWFTTSATWNSLANCYFSELKTVRSWPNDVYRQMDPGRYGWYGYEHGYKMGEFFRIMAGTPPAPTLPTLTFTASSNTITPGQSVTLTWSTTGAASVTATGG